MAVNCSPSAVLRFSLLLFAASICVAKGRVHYVNKQSGYSLDYPASWYRMDPGSVHFDILNFPPDQRIKGVVLKDKGAEIAVSLQPKDAPQSLDDWIKDELAHDQLIESRDISPIQKLQGGCERLQQVISRSEAGPGTYFIYTSLYCVTKPRFIQVLLSNWEGDPNQSNYQAIAVRIANSVRVF
jgi:hypothetical protein